MATWQPLLNIKGPEGAQGPAGDNAPAVIADWNATTGDSAILNKPAVIASGQTKAEARQSIMDGAATTVVRGDGTIQPATTVVTNAISAGSSVIPPAADMTDNAMVGGSLYRIDAAIARLQGQITALKSGGSGGGVSMWSTGTTYAIGDIVISPISYHEYVRITAGAGTTDPSSDKTNWRLIGAGGIKSIQRGVITIAPSQESVAVTISSVDTTASSLSFLGFYSGNINSGGALNSYDVPYLTLTSSTQITAQRPASQSTKRIVHASWQIIEQWS